MGATCHTHEQSGKESLMLHPFLDRRWSDTSILVLRITPLVGLLRCRRRIKFKNHTEVDLAATYRIIKQQQPVTLHD